MRSLLEVAFTDVVKLNEAMGIRCAGRTGKLGWGPSGRVLGVTKAEMTGM